MFPEFQKYGEGTSQSFDRGRGGEVSRQGNDTKWQLPLHSLLPLTTKVLWRLTAPSLCRNSKERSTLSNPSPEIADAGLTSRFTPAELSFKGKAGGAGEEPTEGGADRRSGAKVASTSDATAPLSAPAGADPRSGDHTTAVFRDWHSTIAQNRSRSQHSPAETPTQRSSGGKDKDDTASAFLHENTSPVAPREGSKRPRSVGEKPHSDRYFSSQGLIDELGQQIIEERMVASRLQASLKAEQNALKLAHRANRQANSQVSRLTAEKQCLETEIVKLKTQLQMERRAWDADELHLSDLVQRLTRDTGDLRESIQRSERERRKLTETLNDERHIKECALNFITENNRK